MPDDNSILQSGGERRSSASPARVWTEDVFIGFIVISCLVGSVAIAVLLETVPETVIAVLLATGVSSLVYRFLGGIPHEEASASFGVARVSGTMAALVGLVILLNPMLEHQTEMPTAFDRLSDHNWGWQYAKKGWAGNMQFEPTDEENSYLVSGTVTNRRLPSGDPNRLVRRIEPGSRAYYDPQDQRLTLKLKVRDGIFDREMTWTTIGGFRESRFMYGAVRVGFPEGKGTPYVANIYLLDTTEAGDGD